jgi:hypothetical protein
MPIDTEEQDFLHYLQCDLPFGYPVKIPVALLLSPAQKSSSRRELLHRQSFFLDFAKRYLMTAPWLAYLAAAKHEAVLIAIPTYDEQLVDVVDKLFFRDLQKKYKDLRETAQAAIDPTTTLNCNRLILLQTEAAQIESATKKVAATIQAGFNAVEPLPPPPPEPPPERGLLPYFIASGLAFVVIGTVTPPYAGGMIWGLAGLILTGVVGARMIAKEKARVREKNATYKAYLLHENYQILCRKSVELVLTLPFEVRKTALVNLSPCLAALRALPPEREALEKHYIMPYFETASVQAASTSSSRAPSNSIASDTK